MNNDEIQSGQQIDIPLYLTNGENIMSFEGLVNFNPEHLSYDEIVWSNLLNDFAIEVNVENDEIRVAGAGPFPDGQDGVFATLRFTVNENFDEDETTVSLTNLRWNEETILVDVTSTILTNTLSVGTISNIPSTFSLRQNYPNPFNPTTTLRYDLPEDANVRITVYDLLGRQIINLVNEDVTAGYRSAIWNGTDAYGKPVSSGMYIYQIQAGSFVQSKKMLLLK